MLIKGTLILKDKRPFCLFKNREVGIASGYFAGNMFLTTHEDEYITQVSGESFGWFDADGEYFRDSKYDYSEMRWKHSGQICINIRESDDRIYGKG